MRESRRRQLHDLKHRFFERWAHLVFRLAFAGAPPAGAADLGRAGERRVARAYRLLGYRILDRNVQLAGGEIDLVVSRGDLVAFVEVKTRATSELGRGWEAVDVVKQRQLDRLATLWLHYRRERFIDVRHDVVSVVWSEKQTSVERYVDAFRISY